MIYVYTQRDSLKEFLYMCMYTHKKIPLKNVFPIDRNELLLKYLRNWAGWLRAGSTSRLHLSSQKQKQAALCLKPVCSTSKATEHPELHSKGLL